MLVTGEWHLIISDIINQFNNKEQIPFLRALGEEQDTAMMGDNPVLTKPCFDRNIKNDWIYLW